ncbi:MAG: hypothetical protein JKY34_12695 [Kordiimonadaceae bacterium]|nr:hypothetical protein [Kordiimonadaceae bacterium]
MSGMMGWTPDQLYRATWPELIFHFRGFQKANGIDPDNETPSKGSSMSRDEYEQLKAQLCQK